MAQSLENLHIGMPRPDIPRQGAFVLRAGVLLLFAIGFAVSYGQGSGRLADAFHFGGMADASLLRIDAWVTPPRYTGRPPIYLAVQQEGEQHVPDVPQGSIVTIRAANTDWRTRLVLQQGRSKTIVPPKADASQAKDARVYEVALTQSARLALTTPSSDKGWAFQVIAHGPPSITWIKPPQRAMNGTLDLDYKIDDRFGATKGWVEITPTHKAASALTHPLYSAPAFDLVMPRGGKGTGHTLKDLTNHPWAGANVELRLVIENGAGKRGESAPVSLTLPQRSFGNPLARAVIEQRRLLAQDSLQRGRVADMLSALLVRPEMAIPDKAQALALYSLRARLRLASHDDALRDVIQYMWAIASGIENGNLSAAEQRLKQAQQALREAMRNGASQQEIERLMQALRDAMQDYISMLAQQNTDKIDDLSHAAQMLGADELEKRLKQLEEMAKLGNLGAAEQLLAELEKMMSNLQVMPGGGKGMADGQGKGQQQQMQKQMDALSDMMRRQQQMLDETHRLKDQQQHGGISEEQLRKELNRLQQQQQQLQSELNRLQQDLGQQGLKPGDGLAEAEKSMQNAQSALRDGNGSQATQNQADALEAMRRGGRDLMGKMREAMQKAGEDKPDDRAKRDPLGRAQPNGEPSSAETGTELPGEIDVQRARRILDEIRKRLGTLTPQVEKDYLERLLKFD